MPTFTPVDHDPFADAPGAANGPTFTPVDHDPFAPAETPGPAQALTPEAIAKLPELDPHVSHGGSVVSGVVNVVGGAFDAAHKVATGEMTVPGSFQDASPEEAEAVIGPMADAALTFNPATPARLTTQGLTGIPRADQKSWTAKIFGDGMKDAGPAEEAASSGLTKLTPGLAADGAFTDEALAAIRAAGLDPADVGPQLASSLKATFAEKGASEAAAREAVGKHFGIDLTKGQATRDFTQQQFEHTAARGGYGEGAQKAIAPGFERQAEQIAEAKAQIGQKLAGEQPVIESPLHAGEAVANAAQGVAARAEGVARAAESGANNALAGARGANPADAVEAAEIVAKGVREKADASKAGYQAKYAEANAAPGEFTPGAFDQLGASVKNRIDPTEFVIDGKVTPAAAAALADLEGTIPDLLRGSPSMKAVGDARKRLVTFARGAGTPEDRRAVREVVRQFDNHVENTLDAGLFSGDRAALDKLKDARGAFAEHQRTFKPSGPGDDVGTAMRAITDRNAQPAEVSSFLLGNALTGRTDRAVRVTERIKSLFGTDSPEWAAIQQAHIGQVAVGKTPQEIAGNIEKALTGPGRTLSSRILTPEQVQGLRQYQNGVRIAQAARESVPDWVGDIARGGFNPQKVTEDLIGATGNGKASSAPFARSVKGFFGEASPEWAAVRQAAWQKLTAKAEGVTEDFGSQALANRIAEFTSGKGKQLAQALYTPEELTAMRDLGSVMRYVTAIKGANPNSDTAPAIGAMLTRLSGRSHQILSLLGLIHGGGPAGALAGYGLSKGIEKAGARIVDRGRTATATEALSGAPMAYSPIPAPSIAWPEINVPVQSAPALTYESVRRINGPTGREQKGGR